MNKHKNDFSYIEPLKNFFNIPLNRRIVVASFLLVTGIYSYFASFNSKVIFPGREAADFDFYNDIGNGGNSEILYSSISDSTIDIGFVLRDGFDSPYVGINITNNNASIFRMSPYNRILIEIAGQQVRSVGFSLYASNIYGANNEEVCFYENIDISSERKQYVINLENLKIPDWWYWSHNIPVDERIEPNLQYIYRINIGTAYGSASDIERSLRIYSISFKRDNSSLLLSLIAAEFLLILILLVKDYIKSHKNSSVTIKYKAVDVEREKHQLNSFFDYINNNFQDAGLTLNLVSSHTGINKRRITSSIQKSFGCNFKTYVNKLRINESKRLLAETELHMGEIAFKVGFSNQTHFNRVFKNLEGINPSEFRENTRR